MMSSFLHTRTRSAKLPTLGLARDASAAHEGNLAAKRAAAAAKPVRRVIRLVTVGLATLFMGVALAGGVGVGPALADPFTDMVNTTRNFCNPLNIPAPKDIAGIDQTLFGLNGGWASSGGTASAGGATVLPGTVTGDGAGGLKFNNAVNGQVAQMSQKGYANYGMQTLTWTNYGGDCYSSAGVMSPIANLLFQVLVTYPAVMIMSIMNLAFNAPLYDIFRLMTAPVISLFASLFAPWMVFAAVGFGLPFVWMKAKGSLSKLFSSIAWVMLIMSIFYYVQTNSNTVVSLANNAVTTITAGAACQMINGIGTASQTSAGGSSTSVGGTVTSGGCAAGASAVTDGVKGTGAPAIQANQMINQAIWYAGPYSAWSLGQVGSHQAALDRAVEKDGSRISWSAALLNGQYVGQDAVGAQVQKDITIWNSGDYTDGDGDKSKVGMWMGKKDNFYPRTSVPLLSLIAQLCNDGTTGDEFGYNQNCSAGNHSDIVSNIGGSDYSNRITGAISGGLVMFAAFVVTGFLAFYLIFQKLTFFFLMMFAPLFLAIGAFPDEKRSAFAKRFGEMILANIIKQVMAVVVLLFALQSMSTILNSAAIPALLKPVGIVAFGFSLILFSLPLTKILKAAAKGDASIVDKTVNFPANAVKTTAKVAVVGAAVAGIAVATGGLGLAGAGALASGAAGTAGGTAGAGAAGGAAKAGLGGLLKSIPTALKGTSGTRAAQLLGMGRSPLSRIIRQGSAAGQILQSAGKIQSDGLETAGIHNAGIDMLDDRDKETGKSGAFRYDRDENGNLTAQGRSQAATEWSKGQASTSAERADRQGKADKRFWENYAADHNGERHELDPKSNGGKRASTQVAAASAIAVASANSETTSGPGWGSGSLGAHLDELGSSMEERMGGRDAAASDSQGVLAGYGGTAATMDPRHAATPALNQLAFAMTSGDQQIQLAAAQQAQEAISEFGLPNKVSLVGSSTTSIADFDRDSLAGLMASVPDAGASGDLLTRFQQATAFTVAAATVPESHDLFKTVDAFRTMALDPTTNSESMSLLSAMLSDSIAEYRPESQLVGAMAGAGVATATAAVSAPYFDTPQAPQRTEAAPQQQSPVYAENAPQQAAPQQRAEVTAQQSTPAYTEASSTQRQPAAVDNTEIAALLRENAATVAAAVIAGAALREGGAHAAERVPAEREPAERERLVVDRVVERESEGLGADEVREIIREELDAALPDDSPKAEREREDGKLREGKRRRRSGVFPFSKGDE